MVADNDSGKSIMSEVRTSSGMFLQKAQVCIKINFIIWYFMFGIKITAFSVLRLKLSFSREYEYLAEGET